MSIFRKSYRLQVAAWSALVSGSVLLVFMIGTTFSVREEQREMAEEDAEALAALLLVKLAHYGTETFTLRDFSAALHYDDEPRFSLLAVLEPDGNYRFRDPKLWKDEFADVLAEESSVWTDDGDWRIRRYVYYDWQVFVAANLQDIEEEYIELIQAFGIALPFSLLFVAAGGWWIARRTLQPVQNIADGIASIETTNLSERVGESSRQDEIGRLAQSINRMLERLETGYHQARRFTSDASHELRTPLAILQVELESRMGDEAAHKEDKLAYVRMLEEVHRLKALTHSLLFLSRADSGALEIERLPVGIIEVADDVIDEFRETPEANDLHIEFEKSGEVWEVLGDPLLLRQVIRNLIENAVKFNRPGGSIRCRVWTVEGFLKFEIGNHGKGISEADREEIFKRFFRGEPERGRETGAFGLGLNLAREIARIHGGDVTLVKSETDWTEFSLSLPLHFSE